MGLRYKTISGVGWSALDNVAYFFVTFLVSVVIARLLTPEDFGLLGLTAIFTTISNTIVNGGFSAALIRKKDVCENDYNTVFFVNLSVSLFIYLILFYLAPLVANFFGEVVLTDLIRVSSIGIIIGSLSVVQKVRLTRQINFKDQTKVTLISSVVGGVVGISLALLGFGVWALVAQSLSNITTRTIILWFVNKWFPRFVFISNCFFDLFGFGWKILIIELIDVLWIELNKVVVGRCYSASTLGQYSQSQNINYLFSGNLTAVIQRVTFPVLSSIQNDKDRMVLAYRKIIKVTIFVTSVVLFFVGSVSEPLLYCLLGPQWHEASTYLPVLCICGTIYPLIAVNNNMLQVIGRGDTLLALTVFHKFLGLIPLALGAFIGIFPMLYSQFFVLLFTYVLYTVYSGVHIGYDFRMQMKDVAPSFCIAIILAFSVYFIKYIPISFWIILPLQILIGTIVFIAFSEFICLEGYQEVKAIIVSYINNYNNKIISNDKHK